MRRRQMHTFKTQAVGGASKSFSVRRRTNQAGSAASRAATSFSALATAESTVARIPRISWRFHGASDSQCFTRCADILSTGGLGLLRSSFQRNCSSSRASLFKGWSGKSAKMTSAFSRGLAFFARSIAFSLSPRSHNARSSCFRLSLQRSRSVLSTMMRLPHL